MSLVSSPLNKCDYIMSTKKTKNKKQKLSHQNHGDAGRIVKKNNTSSFYFGAVFLLGAIGASFVLAGVKLGLFPDAPGCGVGSGCDAVSNGPWGKLPYIGWPFSYIGVAWFVSLFVSWFPQNKVMG